MKVLFTKNLIPAPDMGKMYGQHVEPAGWYFTPFEEKDKQWMHDNPPLNYISGVINLREPLIIFSPFSESACNWKYRLQLRYKKTRKALSKAILRDGYDSIIIKRGPDKDHCYFAEGVLLTVIK